jgi:hypothetical protein
VSFNERDHFRSIILRSPHAMGSFHSVEPGRMCIRPRAVRGTVPGSMAQLFHGHQCAIVDRGCASAQCLNARSADLLSLTWGLAARKQPRRGNAAPGGGGRVRPTGKVFRRAMRARTARGARESKPAAAATTVDHENAQRQSQGEHQMRRAKMCYIR